MPNISRELPLVLLAGVISAGVLLLIIVLPKWWQKRQEAREKLAQRQQSAFLKVKESVEKLQDGRTVCIDFVEAELDKTIFDYLASLSSEGFLVKIISPTEDYPADARVAIRKMAKRLP